jgi:crossover junction endodeoxyribonuclease RuvC
MAMSRPRIRSPIRNPDSRPHGPGDAKLAAMRVLGIDCGTEYTGYGVVELRSNDRLRCVTSGAIKLSARDSLPARLAQVYDRLGRIIQEFHPDQVAIEDVFYAVNVKSALKLGQVRGVAMLSASSAGLEVAEYAALSVKSAVVGYGRAEKLQVQHMVTRLLRLQAPPEPSDVADALAIAICHLHTSATLERRRAGAR